MTKNIITIKIEELQESITSVTAKIDDIKSVAQKNLTFLNINKIKDLGQEKRKKYIDTINNISIKNYYNKIKENDYTKLAASIKTDIEGKITTRMDTVLNNFNISSTKDTNKLLVKIEKLEKSLKKAQKEIKKIK